MLAIVAFAVGFVLAAIHGAIILAGGSALVSGIMLFTIFWLIMGKAIWEERRTRQ